MRSIELPERETVNSCSAPSNGLSEQAYMAFCPEAPGPEASGDLARLAVEFPSYASISSSGNNSSGKQSSTGGRRAMRGATMRPMGLPSHPKQIRAHEFEIGKGEDRAQPQIRFR